MRDTRRTPESREPASSAEEAAMKIPPKNRWQVLLIEYELLDAYWSQLSQRVWNSGLFLAGLTMVGIAFLATMLDAGQADTLNMISLIGGVASLLTLGWWILVRRLFAAERVAEYRKNEIERELGMRAGLYLTFLRQNRRFSARRRGAVVARQEAEGDPELEANLQDFAASPEGKPWLPRLMADRMVWNLIPWLLIAAWAGLLYIKMNPAI